MKDLFKPKKYMERDEIRCFKSYVYPNWYTAPILMNESLVPR